MGLMDKLKGKSSEEKKEEPVAPQGKYDEPCALCNEPGTEKKWMGQYWHKKCVRKSRKYVKGMI